MLTSIHAGPPWPVPDDDIYGEWSWLTDDDPEEEELLAGFEEEEEGDAGSPTEPNAPPDSPSI